MGAVHMDMASIKTESLPRWLMTISHMGMSHTDHVGHSMGGGSSTFGMLAAHLLAALLSGLWLAFGEKAVFRILRAVAGWLAAPLRLLLLAPPIVPDRLRVRVRRPQSDHAPRLLLLVHAITSRGPPAGRLSSEDSWYPEADVVRLGPRPYVPYGRPHVTRRTDAPTAPRARARTGAPPRSPDRRAPSHARRRSGSRMTREGHQVITSSPA